MSDSKSPRKNRIASHLAKIPRSGIRDFFEIVELRDDVISMSVGEPDFDTPWHIRDQAIHALDRGATSYTGNRGLLKFRRAVSRYIESAFDLRYEAETEVLITVGVSEALDLAIRAVIEPGDEVLYHEPCYVSYGPLVSMAHGVPVPVQTTADTDFRLTREHLEKAVTPRSRMLLLNFPTNPTGATLEREDLEGIAAFAIEHDLIVVTDEIYSELTYEGERLSIAALPGMQERTIFLHGLSKAWAMTGWRVGYACAPADLTEAMMKIHQYTMLCAPILSQEAGIEALKSPASDIQGMKDQYQRRRNFIHGALNDMGLPCHLPRGAFYVFPYVGDYGMSAKDFALGLLEQESVACVPGDAFGPAGEGFLRCSYATNLDQIKIALGRMADYVARLRAASKVSV